MSDAKFSAANSAITMTVKGLEGAIGMLAGLDEKTVKKLSKQALGRGATVVARAIRSDPDIAKSKRLKKAVGSSLRLQSRRYQERAKVGVGVGKGGKVAPHAHLYILGTKDRYTTAGAFRGAAPAHDAVRRAYASSQGAANAAILQGLAEGVEREAQKGKSK